MAINDCKYLTITVFTGLILLRPSIASPQTNNEQEVKRSYKRLIDAENKHDLLAVKALVWDSASTLFVAKAPVGWRGYWGIDDVLQHLHDMYQQPFRIDPNYEEEKVVFITPNIAETYAPVMITVAYAGQNPVPRPFVMKSVALDQDSEWMEDDDNGHPDSDHTGAFSKMTERRETQCEFSWSVPVLLADTLEGTWSWLVATPNFTTRI